MTLSEQSGMVDFKMAHRHASSGSGITVELNMLMASSESHDMPASFVIDPNSDFIQDDASG